MLLYSNWQKLYKERPEQIFKIMVNGYLEKNNKEPDMGRDGGNKDTEKEPKKIPT